MYRRMSGPVRSVVIDYSLLSISTVTNGTFSIGDGRKEGWRSHSRHSSEKMKAKETVKRR